MRNKIFLVEDDTMIASGIVYALSNEGYDVMHGLKYVMEKSR